MNRSAATRSFIDGHNDTLLKLWRGGSAAPFLTTKSPHHISLPRALKAGMEAGFFAIFPPPSAGSWNPLDGLRQTPGGYEVDPAPAIDAESARASTEGMLAILGELFAQEPKRLFPILRKSDLERCRAGRRLGVVLHFEGAEVLGSDASQLEGWFARGLRSLGIVWSRPNEFGCGVPFQFPVSPELGPGLTRAGLELIDECGRLGVLVDLSHLNAAGFRDVARRTTRPLVATHSAAHRLCPSTRNLLDWQLDAIRDNGGVMGVNFCAAFIRGDGDDDVKTPLADYVEHFLYAADRMGVEHVALGSDFDGAEVSDEIGDITGVPKLLTALRAAGFSEAEVDQIARGNWRRILRDSLPE